MSFLFISIIICIFVFKLKHLYIMIENVNISVHQINTVTGDLIGNTRKILMCLKLDKNHYVDISVFPETAISGYCCGSLWDRQDFIRDQISKLKEIEDYRKKLDYVE